MEDNYVNGNFDVTAIAAAAPYEQWFVLSPSGSHPQGRYKHAAIVAQEKLYVVGGSRNGRYLSDVQVFDFRTLKWSTLVINRDTNSSELDKTTSQLPFPALSGHSLVMWENQILVVGGHSKDSSDALKVWSISPDKNSSSLVQTYGKIPIARGGQSVTLVGCKLIVFGGEDRRRRLLNDLHILDLATMTWDTIETTKTFPSPRFDHIATAHTDQYLLVFGGSSHSTCFNDLHLLDLQTMSWSQPESQGAYVTPRGGHAGTIVDENWYIVGGGDNARGAVETVTLNTSRFVWSIATSVVERHPVASEGLSLCSITIDGEKFLVAFGGYNGNYNSEVFALKIKPRESIRPRFLQSPAAAAAAASVTAAYAVVAANNGSNSDVKVMDDSDLTSTQVDSNSKLSSVDTDALIAEKSTLESKLLDVRDENSRLKANIEEVNNSHAELVKELESVQGQLAAESARCMKLLAQIGQMQKSLESLGSLEHELESLRHEKSQAEKELIVTHNRRSSGVWQWMTGTT